MFSFKMLVNILYVVETAYSTICTGMFKQKRKLSCLIRKSSHVCNKYMLKKQSYLLSSLQKPIAWYDVPAT